MADEWGPWISDLVDVCPIKGSIFWKHRMRHLFPNEKEWRRWNIRYAHQPAFNHKNAKGYLMGAIGGKGYLAHRVIWAFATGRFPTKELDHINGKKDDNRIINLREVSRIENCRNTARRKDNVSGKAGVHFDGSSWVARIGHGSGRKHLGSFPLLADAIAAREAAEVELGYTARHGR